VSSIDTIQDDPFGVDPNGGTSYKTLQWWRAGALLIAETISLGILSLPKVVATVGFVPGVLLVAGLGVLATYTGYVVYQFKRRHMGMHNFANAADLIFGPVGRWIVEIMQALILVFIMAAHILTFTVEMNVLTNHGTCTIVFGIAGTVLSFLLTIPRTYKGISGLSFICTYHLSPHTHTHSLV
jgi:amino acid permease